MASGNRAIEFSERAYRRLLRLYPASHRGEFGEPMVQHVRDLCRDGWRRRGALGLLAAWGLVLRDATTSLITEHGSEGRNAMKAVVQALGIRVCRESSMRALARGFFWLCAQVVLVASVLKLTSLPLTEGQLVIGLLCACAVSLQLMILGVLVVPAKAVPAPGVFEG